MTRPTTQLTTRLTSQLTIWLIPPVAFALAAGLMAALHLGAPLAAFGEAPWRLGLLVGAAGMGLAGLGRRTFETARANLHPFKDPHCLVENGPYRLTRNPMYLGLAIALAGWGLMLGSATPWLAWAGFVAACQWWYIPEEEKRLRAALGEPYLAYCRKVRRWL
ncbi:methyltransferase family protein [Roseospirillum parvum]|uniref:Protein-S-isoprenylcysteine O-methyltransferase Ste14 n=1 Tax=Roseospirillum parvum TaxID=83401 RepID=A0A1G7ZV37_9PROT|nr:isoprenylcysteine carboxylmethyltransferase family protein [Roseospirillum parvum]SDH12513.1 Protein-S-isoprenylcysteine O-methyltransferase Ste14 [Roseospirillum parvum]